MSDPYYADDHVTLHLGDCREILPTLDVQPVAGCADPPYGETSAPWDKWPEGWVDAVSAALPATASLWCFGTARMFLRHAGDFADWRLGQEALWLKRNGSGPAGRDRLVRVHEWAYHWYRGRWSDLHHEWERESRQGPSKGATVKVDRSAGHQSSGKGYTWRDDGTRQPRSVRIIEASAVRLKKRHPTEKPVALVAEIVRESTPPGGLVLDPTAGVCTTGEAARLTGRRALLIESDERFCEIGATRLQALAEAARMTRPCRRANEGAA